MVRVIIFDCFGVLTTDLWHEFIATLPENKVEAARELNRAYDSGYLNRDEFLRDIKKLTGKIPQEVEAFEPGEAVKNDALIDLIRQLRPTYKTAILSNIASNWICDTFLSLEEQKLFDEFIFSRDVAMIKPDPRIFELAAVRLDVVPSECVMVDDIARNALAAESLGMKGVVYQDFEQFKTKLETLLKA